MVSHRVFFGAFGRPRQLLVASVCAIAILAPSCNDSQAPLRDDAATYRGQFDAGSGDLELQLEGASGSLESLRLVVTDLVVDAANHEVHASVAIRNVGGNTVFGPWAIAVEDFVPEEVVPTNGACRVCVTIPCDTWCTFAHHGTYGDDGMLGPGETSTPVQWSFRNPSDESFSFRAHVVNDPAQDGVISGVVFGDVDGDGQRDPDELGLAGASITLQGEFGSQVAGTGSDGRYQIQVNAPGLYELIFGCPECRPAAPPFACTLTTPEQRQVLIVRRADGSLSGFERGDFGCLRRQEPEPHATGEVFEDADGNGVRDSTEAGVPNVWIVAQSIYCDTPALETQTDEQGQYSIALPGCMPWTVGHDALPGFADTTPNPVTLPPERDPGDPTPIPVQWFRVDFGVIRTPEGYRSLNR